MPITAKLPARLKAVAIAAAAGTATIATLGAAPVAAHNHGHKQTQQANIVQTAVSTGVHETLVAAVQAADLVDTLSSPGPFTIFAPTDTAFAKLPAGTVAALVKPENKATLTKILTYHAVAGRVTSSDLMNLIKAGGGTATIDTVAGETLTARISGKNIVITDGAGGTTAVTTADVNTSNGVIHVTDGVFLPA